jgi:hypothetical protein
MYFRAEKLIDEGHLNAVPFLRIASHGLHFAVVRPGWAGDGWQ